MSDELRTPEPLLTVLKRCRDTMTPGEWTADDPASLIWGGEDAEYFVAEVDDNNERFEANAAGIADLHNNLPRVIACLTAAEGMRAALVLMRDAVRYYGFGPQTPDAEGDAAYNATRAALAAWDAALTGGEG